MARERETIMLPPSEPWWRYKVLTKIEEIVDQIGEWVLPEVAELLYTSGYEGQVVRKGIDSNLSNPAYLGGEEGWPPIKATDFTYPLLGIMAFFKGVYDGISGKLIEEEIKNMEKRKKELGIDTIYPKITRQVPYYEPPYLKDEKREAYCVDLTPYSPYTYENNKTKRKAYSSEEKSLSPIEKYNEYLEKVLKIHKSYKKGG
ncbi:MAG TPA: hypothetical protein EYH56_02640 [Nanoarchaeota archaeon]|nr:hypothetical protein [Nanoarchaeota archaeon]